PCGFRPLGALPLTAPRAVVSGCAFPRSVQEQQTRLTSPSCRTPSGQEAGTRQTPPGPLESVPVLMPPIYVTTRQRRPLQRGTAHRLPGPHLAHLVRLFHLAHHDGLQPTQQVVV